MADTSVPAGAGDEESQIKEIRAVTEGSEEEPSILETVFEGELYGEDGLLDLDFRRCSPLGIAHRILLCLLLGGFLVLPAFFIRFLSRFLFRPSTFYGETLGPALVVVGFTCLVHQGFVVTLGVIQVVHFGSYEFLRKCRVSLICVLVSYICHILFFLPLTIRHFFTLDGRLVDIMKFQLSEWNSQTSTPSVLDPRWKRTQETYNCCGFGGKSLDYRMRFPSTCCRKFPCNETSASGLNCYTLEQEVWSLCLPLAIKLLWAPIPLIVALLLAFRCVMPVCVNELETNYSLTSSITSEEEEDEHRDLKYVKITTHTSVDAGKTQNTWPKREWNKLMKWALGEDSKKARLLFVTEKEKKAKELSDKRLEIYRRMDEEKRELKRNASSKASSKISNKFSHASLLATWKSKPKPKR